MSYTPVIIGVADVKNKTEEHKEPATLMLEAIVSAIQDTGCRSAESLTSQIDSIDVVRTWTWPYADLPGLLSDGLGLGTRPKWARYTETHGGNQPARLVDEAAGRIARGDAKVAVVTGGEALASCERAMPLCCRAPGFRAGHLVPNPKPLTPWPVSACAKAGMAEPPGWTKPEMPVQEAFSPTTADLGEGWSSFVTRGLHTYSSLAHAHAR